MNPGARSIHVSVRYSIPLVAFGLNAALLDQPGIVLLAERDDDLRPRDADVVVTDLSQGLRLARAHGASVPKHRPGNPPMLVVTSADQENAVSQAFESGIRGYLMLGCELDELLLAVRVLANGGRYICPSVARRVAESLAREALTPRENEVLRVLMRGACNKDIARELAIAVGTVKAHVKAIMEKLGASCRTEAVSIAAERGLVDDHAPVAPPAAWARQENVPALGQWA